MRRKNMNNTATGALAVSSAGMALISINDIQSIVYIVIAVISLLLTIVTAFLNYRKEKKVSSDDLKDITTRLDDIADHVEEIGKDKEDK